MIFIRQYLEIYDHTVRSSTPQELFHAAAREFARSRQIFETLAAMAGGCSDLARRDLNSLIAVTKNNFVASSILAKDASRSVELEFGAHNTEGGFWELAKCSVVSKRISVERVFPSFVIDLTYSGTIRLRVTYFVSIKNATHNNSYA